MQSLFSDDTRRNPYPLYDHLRAASPVFQEPQSGHWMLFDYDSVKRALNDAATFSSVVSPNSPRTSRWLIFADPPRHTQLRGLIMRAFTPRAVAALEPRIRELSRELLDGAAQRGEMDLVADYAVPLPLMVIAEMLGAPVADRPRFRRWTDAIVALSHAVANDARAQRAVESFAAAHDEMAAYLPALLEARRRAPQDDLLTRLVEVEVEGERLTEEDILGFFQLLLLAGHETTANLISNAVLSLVEHPDQLARIQAAPRILPGAIEEVLRFRSPVQAVFRATRQEVEMRGRTIPAGQLVLAWIGAANRDPAHFDQPARFDVGRDPNPHVAFGHGIHFCIGAALARMEGRVALAHLLERLGNIELAGVEPWEPREAFHVHGPTRLPIRFEPREPAAV
ncbi:cytochrome P450 [Longimicrobium sp.]|uniref:cytochrome P450 n=1 Tax=Longimicrobium sp. TaxID=2029185 RepID=UPI002BFFF295|nr:cytochrome P450 [Longimicrobium sp.]HSU17472.1 cytochrome P450 [Longimicrobium sp.]